MLINQQFMRAQWYIAYHITPESCICALEGDKWGDCWSPDSYNINNV